MQSLLARKPYEMTDSTYRTKITPSAASTETPSFENKTKDVTQTPTSVQPPFTEYEAKEGKPYVVEYFDLGRFWDSGEAYTKEVETINTYLNHLIHTGEINNSTEAVKDKMKRIEKMINVDPDDRKASRVGRVAAYMEFLIKADNIKKQAAKYGMV
jgi:hypothetical protein